ncbi:MAG TPA: hypothetical protein VGB50_07460 [Flavobacterium sp.]|jgi:hypothetical protein
MKRLILLTALIISGFLSAQTDAKTPVPEQPVDATMQGDTITTNKQVREVSDMKNMDAVKTQDHPKTTRKQKAAPADSLKMKKNSPSTGTGKSTNRP